MSKKTNLKPLAIALGAAFVTTLATTPVANAAENPFAMSELSSGYMVADATEGKCGGDKKMDKEGKCGEGKCGGDKKVEEEGKCGEGKCGGDKKMDKEGKCGEGKCGGDKK
jgi:uncharacterized low-complexity protein